MSYFAQLDENDIVVNVIVVEKEDIESGRFGDPKFWIETDLFTRHNVHYDSNNNPVQTNLNNPIQAPAIITGLSSGTYKVIVSDSNGTQCVTNGLTINGPIPLFTIEMKILFS